MDICPSFQVMAIRRHGVATESLIRSVIGWRLIATLKDSSTQPNGPESRWSRECVLGESGNPFVTFGSSAQRGFLNSLD